MGQQFRSFERENETVGHGIIPRFETRRPLQRIKGAVDFERVEAPSRESQLDLLRKSFGIEIPAPWRVRPTGDADANLSHAAKYSHSMSMRPVCAIEP